MGKKIEETESAVMRAFSESMQKLSSFSHSNDKYEAGYAQALFDVKQIIDKLK